MGTSIKSKLMYGVKYSALVDTLDDVKVDLLNEGLDDGYVDYASPYYDSRRDEWFVGFEVGVDFDFEGIRWFENAVDEAEKLFKEKYGRTGAVRSCVHVT